MKKSKGNILLLVLGLFVVVVLLSQVLLTTALRSVQTTSKDYEQEQVYIITKDVLGGLILKIKQNDSVIDYIEDKACSASDGRLTASTVVEFEDKSYPVDFVFDCNIHDDVACIEVEATGYSDNYSESIMASFARTFSEDEIVNEDAADLSQKTNDYIKEMLDAYNKNHGTNYEFPSDAAIYTSYAKDILGLDIDWLLALLGLNGDSVLMNSTFNGAIYSNSQNLYIYNSVVNGEINFRYSSKGFRLYTKMGNGPKKSIVGSLSNVRNRYVCSTNGNSVNGEHCIALSNNVNKPENREFRKYLEFSGVSTDPQTHEVKFSEEVLDRIAELAVEYKYKSMSECIQAMFMRKAPTLSLFSTKPIENFHFDNSLWKAVDEEPLFDDIPRIIDLYTNNKEKVITRVIKLNKDFNGIIYAPSMYLQVDSSSPITINGQVAVCGFNLNNVTFNYVNFIAEGGVDDSYHFEGYK